MAVPNMPGEEMRAVLKELEQAIYNHDRWAEMLHGTLICRLAPDERDVDPDAHRKCRFGQWYYKSGTGLVRHAGFAEIGGEHEHMHQYAASLLRASAAGKTIAIEDYERFVTALKRMRLEIATVERELEDAIFNLDPLTETPSRLGMLTKLREEREFVRRNVHPCAVAMMDLDGFKMVNDRYGHIVGDKVLNATARCVTAHLRSTDKVFRYGGEEFLICLPDTDLQAALDLCGRLREAVAALHHEAGSEGPFHVTVSVGLALLDPDVSVEASIDRADRAMYAAKAAGRNRVSAWEPAMAP